ncbi:MAG TPA: nodulation protein NfeD [Anaerolineae bacterium]|nr:nodulation protein NfeD [Anaerolineae bacterium]
MKRLLSLILLALLLLTGLPALAQPNEGPIVVIEVQGVINPLTARYLDRTLRLAEQRAARVVVLLLDTPGGLESAMREMVQALLESPLPTVVYVTPRGARATSAGLFITLAADVAAMAPATHIGAAHPVPLGGEIGETMEEKMTSDAAALMRSVAIARGRNAEWAERAVRDNLSVTADEALEQGIIDLVAQDLDDLLRQLDGRRITAAWGTVVLHTAGAPVERQPMNLIEQFMHIISDPNIAYLLLSIGALCLMAELAEPGLSVPGIAGAVCFLLAFMALGSLPVNWVGVALLALAVVLFAVGLFTETEAIVTVAGLVPFILGSLLLFSPFTPTSPAAPDLRVSPWLIGAMSLGILAFSFVVLRAIIAANRLPPQSGAERLVGRHGVASTDLTPEGQVRVELEDWSAMAVEEGIRAGEPVRVVGIAGVRLRVARVETQEKELDQNQGGA